MNWATWLWFGWGGYFLIVEGVALFNSKRGDTLSEHVWLYLGYSDGVKYPTGWTRLRRFLFVAFWGWLTLHFFTGGLF